MLFHYVCFFRVDQRLEESRVCLDQDAGGKRGPQGEDPAPAGRHPEEQRTGGALRGAQGKSWTEMIHSAG